MIKFILTIFFDKIPKKTVARMIIKKILLSDEFGE